MGISKNSLHAMTLGLALTWLAILLGGWLGWQLLRQNGRILLRLDELEKRLNEFEFGEDQAPAELPAGAEAPAFELPDLIGKRHSLAEYRGQPILLIFFNPGCGFCREMLPNLAQLPQPVAVQTPRSSGRESAPSEMPGSQSRLTPAATAPDGNGADHPRLLILTTGDAEKNRRFFAGHKINCPVLLQSDGDVAKAYQANGTPSGYLISPEGRIASNLAMGADALLALADGKSEIGSQKSEEGRSVPATNGEERANRFSHRSLARSKINRDGLRAGAPAPDFRLPRLDGRGDLTLSELRGKRALLVFSSPGCGPCNTLAPELEKFHRQHPELEVVMISKGEAKENRAKVKEHGLTFPIVLQQHWEVSRRYAMFATPIAYLIDGDGIVAKDAAVGSDAILNLMTALESHEPLPFVVRTT
jgi:peroxiredoxin